MICTCKFVAIVGNFAPHTRTGSMVTYSSMPGKKMLTPVVVAGSPELGPVTGRRCSNVAKGVPLTTVVQLDVHNLTSTTVM
jgi:hypothetical protein